MRLSAADGVASRDAGRDGVRAAPAQLLALEPSLSIEPLRGNIDTRLRKRSERGLDAIVLAACGLDRLGSGRGDRPSFRAPTRCCPKRDRVRWRCRCGPARRSSSARLDDARDAEAGRSGAGLRRLRSAAAASLPSLRTTTATELEALDRRRGRPLDRAPSRGRSGRAAPGSSSSGSEARAHRMRVVVTRAPGQAEPLASRATRARARSRALPADSDRPDRRRPGRAVVIRLGDRHEPERCDELLNRARGRASQLAAIGPGTAATLLRRGVAPDLVAGRLHAGRAARGDCRDLRAACCSLLRKGRAWPSSDELGADFLPLYRTIELATGAARGRRSSYLRPHRPPARSARSERNLPAVSIGPQTSRRGPRERHSRSSPKRSATISTASSTRSLGSIPDAAPHHVPYGLRCHRRPRGDVSRRHEAHRAGGRRSSTSPTASSRSRCSRARSCSRNTLPYMPEGVHLAVVDPRCGHGSQGDRV